MDLLCLGVPHDGKKRFYHCFSISVCMQDLLCQGKPHIGKTKQLIIYFSISLCMQDILCLGISILEIKEALSLFFDQSVQKGPFVSEYAPCLKEKRLYQ